MLGKNIKLLMDRGTDPDDYSRKLMDFKIIKEGFTVAKIYGASFSENDVEYVNMISEKKRDYIKEPKRAPYSYAKLKEDTKIEMECNLDLSRIGVDVNEVLYNEVKDAKDLMSVESCISMILDDIKNEVKMFFYLKEEDFFDDRP